jgi:hypothetical protein
MDRKVSYTFVDSTDLLPFQNALLSAIDNGVKSIIVFACSGNQYNDSELSKILASSSIRIFGGIFPAIIYQGQTKQRGTLFIEYSYALDYAIFSELSQLSKNIVGDIQQQYRKLSAHKNFMILADGLSQKTEQFIENFYDIFGDGIQVIGGGAGSLTFSDIPCLISNEGVSRDAIQVIAMPSSMRSVASHGWQVIDGPFLATEVNQNHILSLNYEAAFSLYANSIEKISQDKLNGSNFVNITKQYPLGIRRGDGSLLVRDPIQTNNYELTCVGNVPSNSMVYILTGDKEKLLEAAAYAAESAFQERNQADIQPHNAAMVFDCISRYLYFGEEFQDELDAIRRGLNDKQMIVGVMSLGEIANLDSGVLGFLNKSVVVGSF